ncbi:MAG: 23S rRNA (pseudouridine(1915)-N(3))-methyltransferase RlmH [Candidatus Krumholzibacteriia bacterium]
MLRILAVGRMKDGRLAALLEDYAQRIRPLAPLEIVELKDADPPREGRAMVERLGSARGRGLVVALDERGEDLSSVEFAALLGGNGTIAFLVGGADGLGPAARERADRSVRLSSLTLTHEMARVLLAEQIYRGLTILRGRPYHRA